MGIYILSIAGKIFARIILNGLISTIVENNLPESVNINLYSIVFDLTKAFATVDHPLEGWPLRNLADQ